jgi:hypothetical protein
MSCDVCPSNKLMLKHGDWFIWYFFPFPFSQISHGHKACYTPNCIDCNISKAYKLQDEYAKDLCMDAWCYLLKPMI